MLKRTVFVTLCWWLGTFCGLAFADGDNPQLECGCLSFKTEPECTGDALAKKEGATDADRTIGLLRKSACSWKNNKCEFDTLRKVESCVGQKTTPPCESKVADKKPAATPEKAPANPVLPPTDATKTTGT